MHEAGRSVVGAVAVAGAMSLAGEAAATVSTTLVADTYIVKDGAGASAKFYAVLDIYVRGTSLGDVMSSVSGLNGTSGHSVVFATSNATGTGLTRDASGRITGGTITRDIFVQAGGSSWAPTYGGTEAWDSFVTCGARKQNACVTNRANVVKCYNAANFQGSADFNQYGAANANYINNGGGVAWLSPLGASPYSSAYNSEVPFGRVSLYSDAWAAVFNYSDLDKSGEITKVKGVMQYGRTAATGTATFSAAATGSAIDSPGNYFYMIGRFAVDATNANYPLWMNVQFNMVGKNGTGNETGATFTGAATASYKVSQFFSFTLDGGPPLCPSDLDGNNVVDPADVGLLLLDFGPCFGCPSDLDRNGTTDTADLGLLLLDFGAC